MDNFKNLDSFYFMPKTSFDSRQVLEFYREYELLKRQQQQVADELKNFKELCKDLEIPFTVFQRVYSAEQKNKASCSTVKREVAREFDVVKVLEEALIEADT